MIILNHNNKSGIKTPLILTQAIFDPLMEECWVQSLVHPRVNTLTLQSFLTRSHLLSFSSCMN